MKDKTALKVAFWANAALLIIGLLGGSTLIQASPFILFLGILGSMIWNKKDYKVAAIVVAGLMVFINLMGEPAEIDVLAWILSLVLVIL